MQTADFVPPDAEKFHSLPIADMDALHAGLIADSAALHETALCDLTGSSVADLRRLTNLISGRLDQLEAAGNA